MRQHAQHKEINKTPSQKSAKLNFSGPEFVFTKFWEVLKKIIWQLILKCIRSKMAGNAKLAR